MATVRVLNEGDFGFDLDIAILDSDGTAFDLTGYTLKFRLVNKENSLILIDNALGTINASPTTGLAIYTLVDGDTNTVGLCESHAILEKSGTKITVDLNDIDIEEVK